MADEVTKKDLQSLQGYCNKQIADIAKRVDKAEGAIAILQDLPTKEDKGLAELIRGCYDKFERLHAEHTVKISQLAERIAALEKG